MTGSETLKSYLVKLGFKIDPSDFKKFKESLASISKTMGELAVISTATATTLGASVVAIASHLEKLFFASQRTGASVANIQALRYGAEQVGVGAEQAQAALEGMASAIRLNPGLAGLLKSMNINPDQDKVKVLLELVDHIRKLPFYQGARYAELFGIDPQTLVMMEKNFDELKKYADERQRIAGQAGLQADKMSAKSHEFMQKLRGLEERFSVLWDLIAARFMPIGEVLIDWLDKVVDFLIRADRATSGWSSVLLGLVSAASTAVGGLKVLKTVLGFFGFGGGGEAAAATAGIGAGGIFAAFTVFATAAWLTARRWREELEGIKDIFQHMDEYIKHPLDTMYRMLTGKAMPDTMKKAWEGLKADTADSPEQAAIRGAVHKLFSIFSSGDGAQGKPQGAGGGGSANNGNGLVPLNNPGNLRKWGNLPTVLRGKNGSFVQFQSAFDGLSAMAGNLLAYSRRGVKTIASIIAEWAPSSENDTQSYIKDVSKRMGLDPSTVLDMHNPGTLEGLMQSMIQHEQGKNPFNTKLIEDAINYRLAQDTGGQKVELSQKTEINIHGSGDPKQAGQDVLKGQERVNGDLLRNLAGVVF